VILPLPVTRYTGRKEGGGIVIFCHRQNLEMCYVFFELEHRSLAVRWSAEGAVRDNMIYSSVTVLF